MTPHCNTPAEAEADLAKKKVDLAAYADHLGTISGATQTFIAVGKKTLVLGCTLLGDAFQSANAARTLSHKQQSALAAYEKAIAEVEAAFKE